MSEFAAENFWWKNITGPSGMIRDAVNALSEGYSVILGVPDFTAWADKMRSILHEDLSGGDVYVTMIDAAAECSVNAEEYLLTKYDTERRFRSRLSTVQEYLMRTGALRNHIFWLHNFRDKSQVTDWHNFCSKYQSDSADKGLFILDSVYENLPSAGRMKAVNFSEYAESYDTRIFALFLLDAEGYDRPQYSRNWKQYISLLSAMLCGSDAEVAERFIRLTDFTCNEPYDALEMIAGDFPERGMEGNHILNLLRNEDEDAVMNRIWTAQVQIFFPMIELARVKILRSNDELRGRIAFALSYMESHGFPMTQSDGRTVTDPEDLDIGGLFHILCKSNMIKMNDVMLNEYVSILRTFRNSLAHMTPCRVDSVRELLDFERHYWEK